jgi:hypothetical protein
MLKDLPDDQFSPLIFTSEDRLGLDFVEEAKRRKEYMLPFLSRVLSEEKNYQAEGAAFWGVIHAVYLLGIFGDLRGFDGLVSASRFANVYDIDWIPDVLPECYFRMGRDIIPLLMAHIDKEKYSGILAICSETYALWNFLDTYPEEKEKIEAFLLQMLKDPEIDPETRALLIYDFVRLGRRDLKPMFEEYFKRGEVDLEFIGRDDLDYFFGKAPEPPGYRRDLESFYSPESIEKRQQRWEKEEKDREQSRKERYILENYRRISRNDPCPCGSGKKFKKCHLQWAEAELLRLPAEEELDEDSRSIREAVSIERSSESELRRLLAKKDKTGLFSEIKERCLDLIKIPQSDLSDKGFDHFFTPIISKVGFESEDEFEEFMTVLVEYYNALAAQFPADYPRGKGSFH